MLINPFKTARRHLIQEYEDIYKGLMLVPSDKNESTLVYLAPNNKTIYIPFYLKYEGYTFYFKEF